MNIANSCRAAPVAAFCLFFTFAGPAMSQTGVTDAPLDHAAGGSTAKKEPSYMKNFDVQSVAIAAPHHLVFSFVADPANLPRWAKAFKSADTKSAVLETPAGETPIKLDTLASVETGTVDWRMTFPDGSVGMAYSRVTPVADGRSAYSFVLMAPPVPLERLEGALEAQKKILAGELLTLKSVIEAR